MAKISNPIIRGFNPDPSFVRVGGDYYIATSTFEWFPGVQIHHSRDLMHWRLIGHALTRRSQLDLRGVGNSGGVWAPSLSHRDGLFWLVYTNVRSCGQGRPFKDIGIFLTTAPGILGPWSDPIPLNSIGFDPSLFHDDDGRKWLVNMLWDFRKGRHRFAGIVVQEYDPVARRLVGPMTNVLAKPGVLIEGPNLYRHGGWYYLMLAEGGTGWNHSISMARARSVLGPYAPDPQAFVLTTRDDASHPLQKAGHGEIVETAAGEWYLAHLASRPLGNGENRRCVLGRETCLQRVVWSEDGWLRLAHGGWHPRMELPAPAGLPEAASAAAEDPASHEIREMDHFDEFVLDPHWSTLRIPMDESWLSLRERPGFLRVRGRESQHSLFEQSLVARRLRSLRTTIRTCVEFVPTHFTQSAGLVCWYDTETHYYLRITHDEQIGVVVGITLTDDSAYDELADSEIPIGGWTRVYLQAEINGASLQFSASPDGENWRAIGPTLDASKLSDDYGKGLHFTGAFAGICAHDTGGTNVVADFDYFETESDPGPIMPRPWGGE